LEPQGLLAGVVHVLVWAHRMWGLCRGRLLAVPGAKAGKAGGGRWMDASTTRSATRSHPRFTFLRVLRVHHSEDPRTGDLLLPLSPPGQVFPPKQIKKDPAESQKQAKKKREGKGAAKTVPGIFGSPNIWLLFNFIICRIRKIVSSTMLHHL